MSRPFFISSIILSIEEILFSRAVTWSEWSLVSCSFTGDKSFLAGVVKFEDEEFSGLDELDELDVPALFAIDVA